MKRDSTLRYSLAGSILLAMTAGMPAFADYQSTVLSQSPVGYYRLSETAPAQPPITAAANTGSLGGSGTYQGSQGFFRGFPGALSTDTAVHFDGSSQDVVFGPDASLYPGSFTVETWVKTDVTSANCILSCGTFSNPRSGWLIYQTGATGYEFRLYHGTDTTTAFAGNVGLIGTFGTNIVGLYTHVVATFDGTTAKIYINGSLANSSTLAFPYLPGVGTSQFSIGMRADTGFRWSGSEDEVAYYNTVLSAATIASHYSTALSSPASYPGLVAASSPLLYFRLNEAGDPPAANAAGTPGTTGAYSAGTTPGSPGPRPSEFPGFEATNNSVIVDGLGSSVAIPNLKLNTNAITISCWLKPSTDAQAAAGGIVVCDSGTTYSGLTIDGVNGGLGLGYVWNNDPNTYNWSPSVDSGLPTLPSTASGEWAFAALIVEPTKAAIFICPSNNAAAFAGVTNIFNHVPQAFDTVTLVGSDAGNYNFAGNVDEVAIFNRALGVGEVYSQYAASVGGIGPKIFNDPQTATFFSGDTLTVSVDAGGTPGLSYQWRKSSGDIAGATSSSYSKPNCQTTDSDTYSCRVTNLFGNVLSAPATITVNPSLQPQILSQSGGHNLYPGGSINLSVTATGGGLKYQWSKNSSPISGATLSSYQVYSVVASNAGTYSVTVTNNAGTTSSTPALITILTATNAYETAIVNDKPEAWYRLNETSGTNMFDSMGRHDGVYTNSTGSLPTLGASGAIVGSTDKAVTFDGTSLAFGLVPFDPLLNTHAFSIECWVKTSDTANNRVALSSHSSGPAKGYGIWSVPAGSISGEVSSGNTDFYVGSSTASDGIVAGQWKHAVMVYDTTLKIYVNGQWDGIGYVDFDRNPSAPFVIGAFGPIPVTRPWQGQVDEVIVYTNGLTLAQAQNHYSLAVFPNPIPPFFLVLPGSQEVLSNSAANITLSGTADGPLPITYQWYKNGSLITGATTTSLLLSQSYSNGGSYVLRATNPNGFTNSPPATLAVIPPSPGYVNVTNGLVLHLRFDGNYADSSGRGHNGTAAGSNMTPSFVTGRIGSGAVHYENWTDTGLPANISTPTVTSNSYVTLGNPADLLFGTSTDFSVSYWTRLPANYLGGDLPAFCSASGSFGNPGFTFAPGYTNGSWSFSYNGVCQVYGGANTINDGNWHHLVHTISRTGLALTYLDGAPVDSRLATGIGNISNAGPINIGQDPTALYPEQGKADVDDLAVWRRSLSAYEAYSIYYAATNSNASFDIGGSVALSISPAGTNVVISWKPGSTLGTLQQADDINGPWTAVGAFVPQYQVPATAARKFYRVSFIE